MRAGVCVCFNLYLNPSLTEQAVARSRSRTLASDRGGARAAGGRRGVLGLHVVAAEAGPGPGGEQGRRQSRARARRRAAGRVGPGARDGGAAAVHDCAGWWRGLVPHPGLREMGRLVRCGARGFGRVRCAGDGLLTSRPASQPPPATSRPVPTSRPASSLTPVTQWKIALTLQSHGL